MLFWRMFAILAVVYLLLVAGFVSVIANREEALVTGAMTDQLRGIAFITRDHLPNDLARSADREVIETIERIDRETNVRITLVDANGDVVADSRYGSRTQENQLDAPEIVDARNRGKAVVRRFSKMAGDDQLYVCLARYQITNNSDLDPDSIDPLSLDQQIDLFVRVSIETRAMDRQIAALRRFLWYFAIALAGVAALATQWVVRGTVHSLRRLTVSAKAISRGDLTTPIEGVTETNEFGTLARAFEEMQHELSQRENSLRHNTQRLETVLASMSEGVVALSKERRIEFSNRAAKHLLDFPQESMDGRDLIEVTRLPAIQEAVEQAGNSEQPVRCELETLGNNRRVLSVRIVRVPSGAETTLVAVFHDVTDIRQLETMRRDFVANVSHELKTPLASIKAYAETLKLGAINDSERNMQFVNQIEFQADRLHQLILDLIQLARVESGQTVFDVTDVNVAEIVESSVCQFNRLAVSRDIKIEIDGNDSLRVMADVEGLQTILDNLISNAIRYTQPEGLVTIRFRFQAEWDKST